MRGNGCVSGGTWLGRLKPSNRRSLEQDLRIAVHEGKRVY